MPISILFEPLSASSFKWQGEFGPQARGPQAFAASAETPLPSTVAGALAGLALALKDASMCSGCSNDPYYDTFRGLSLFGKDVRIRGPFIYVELAGGSGDSYILCVPHGRPGSSRVYCVLDSDGSLYARIVEVPRLQTMGIALDSLSKTVLEGYIYTSLLLDMPSAARSIVRAFSEKLPEDSRLVSYGLLVEFHGDIDTSAVKQLDEKVVALGGEQRPARIRVIDGAPAFSIAERVASRCECCYWHIATPMLFCGEKSLGEGHPVSLLTSPDWLLKRLAELAGCRLCGVEVSGRLVFTAIGLGYDMCRGSKRKYCRALLPGSGLYLDASAANWRNLYINGIGSYTQLGWGTIIPLPPRTT